jgi:hypothetical protein
MRSNRVQLLRDGWPLSLGVLVTAVSCALLKAPPDLSASADVDDIYEQGRFTEPDGTITEGGTLAGEWTGECLIYGYPYELELDITEDGSGISGSGTFSTGWTTFDGTLDGSRTATGVQMVLDLDYYGYPIVVAMDAEFSDGVTLEGDCEYAYGSMGTLRLERS